MRTQWTTKGNRDAGSSCSGDRELHRYLRNFGRGLNPPNFPPPTPPPPLGTPLRASHQSLCIYVNMLKIRRYHVMMVIQSYGYSSFTHISAVCIWTWTVMWVMRWLPFCLNTSFVHVPPHWCFCNVLWKNVPVSDVGLSVYSNWIPCEGETAQMQLLLCVYIGSRSVRRWVTWSRDEHSWHTWACHNMMHAANTVTYIMANDEIFNQEMKWQRGAKKKAKFALLANMVMEFYGLHVGWFLD